MNKLTGLILCGGKGSRLKNIADSPKPLIKLKDKEILTKKHNVKTLELPKSFEDESGNIWPNLKFKTDVLMSVGDTITSIDIDDLYEFHKKNKSDLTITSKIIDYKIPFGTMIKRGNKLKKWREKPQFRVEVALGLSIINKDLFKLIPNRKFDIPDLFNSALEKGYRVFVYPYYNDYIKIDTIQEYEEAQQKINLMHRD